MAKIWMIMLLAACAAALGTGRMGQCAQALMQCGDEAVSLMNTIAVAAVDFHNFTVFQNHFHHPGSVQLAAVAGNVFRNFHL